MQLSQLLLPSIEPGVSLDLAEHRKLTLSDINYQLEFTLPADHRDPIPARGIVSFSLSDASQPLVLDFLESHNNLSSVEVNGKASDYEAVLEHLIIPAEELICRAKQYSDSIFLAEIALSIVIQTSFILCLSQIVLAQLFHFSINQI